MNKIKNSIETDVIRLLSHCIREKVDPKNIQNHPIRVFEAAKSMNRLNLGNPSIILIDYMKTKKKSINFLHSELDTKKKAKTVSIYQLEEAINKNDYQESYPKFLILVTIYYFPTLTNQRLIFLMKLYCSTLYII